MVKCQNYKGGVRVSILCGKRAVEYINVDRSIVEELTLLLTTGRDRITEQVRKMSDDIYALKGQMAELRGKLLEYELREIDVSAPDVFMIKEAGLDSSIMRNTVNALAKEHSGFCAVFSGSAEEGYKYILASGTEGRDSRLIQNVLKDEFGAKGGGSPAMVQGSIPAGAVISDVIDKCRSAAGV